MNIRSPALAIAWEIWRKNRWGFLVVYGSLLCGLAARLLGPSEDEVPRFIAGAAMVVSFLVMFTIFSYADGGAQIAFPSRTFTLPVRTGTLINCPILFGALGITVLHFAWVFLLLMPSEARYPLGPFTIYWIVALMTFQAIVWCLANCPKSFVIALLLTMSLFVRLAVVLVEDIDASRAVVCLLVVLPVAYLGARVGIKRQRRGQWRILTGVQELMDKTTGALFRRKRPFATTAQAQLWMEWRRNAVTPLISLGVGLALVCAGFVRFGSTDGLGVIAVAWFYLCCVLLTLWASITGLLLARDASSKSLSPSSFLATRPVTSGELAFAKIKLAGLMTLVGWLVYATGLFLWFHFCWHPDQFVTRQDGGLIPAVGFVALALAWHLFGLLPVWITGRIESVVWAGLLLLGGYIAFGNALQFLDKHFGLLVALPWVFGFALVAKILVALWSFREANRRRLLSPRVTAKYFLFWLLGTICIISVASALCRGSIFPQPLVALTAGLLFPFARAGLAPLALARGRHR